MPGGDLHTEVGPRPKLNPRSCANKEEKGKLKLKLQLSYDPAIPLMSIHPPKLKARS